MDRLFIQYPEVAHPVEWRYAVLTMANATQGFKGAKGTYHLLAQLAAGGMAEIWLAKRIKADGNPELVVVKKMHERLASDKKYLEMFIDEARVTSRLDHPNIVRVIETGKSRENIFIILEYLEGESLGYLARKASEQDRPLPPELAAGIAAQVCDALEYAHRAVDAKGRPLHIIHRDISPGNIIVLYSGRVKLVDFGIAQAADKMHLTRTGVTKGKLAYMSPEQATGRKLDGRSDIFSLGIVLWELLARKRLFHHEVELHTLRAIAACEIPPIRGIRPDVPAELEAVAIRALKKTPKERYPTAGQMGAALRTSLRQLGAAAVEPRIREFYQIALTERVETKRKLLRQIESASLGEQSLEMLKPATEASLPSAPSEQAPVPQPAPDEDRPPPEVHDASEADDEEEEEETTAVTEKAPDNTATPTPATAALDNGEEGADEEVGATVVEQAPAGQAGPGEAPHETSPATTRPDDNRADEPAQPEEPATGSTAGSTSPSPQKTEDEQAGESTWFQDEAPAEVYLSKPPAASSRRTMLPLGIFGVIIVALVLVLVLDPGDDDNPSEGEIQPSETDVPGDTDTRPAVRDAPDDNPASGDPNQPPSPGPDETDGEERDPQTPAEKPGPENEDARDSPPGPSPVHAEQPAPPAPEPAMLVLRTEPPGCRVRLDGKRLAGTTPLDDFEIAPGTDHRLLVACRGHQAERRRFRAAPGERVELEVKARPAPAVSHGYLKLNTEPWTNVSLGKRSLGVTPVLRARLPAGKHRLQLVNRELGIDQSLEIVIRPGKTTNVFKRYE